jgi:hypothetical protein
MHGQAIFFGFASSGFGCFGARPTRRPLVGSRHTSGRAPQAPRFGLDCRMHMSTPIVGRNHCTPRGRRPTTEGARPCPMKTDDGPGHWRGTGIFGGFRRVYKRFILLLGAAGFEPTTPSPPASNRASGMAGLDRSKPI